MVRFEGPEGRTMPRVAAPLPAALSGAAERFEAWRRQRTGREIPADLWAVAADLAARFGVSRTARALRVQYYDLKKRVPADEVPERSRSSPVPAASFVEILTASPAAGSDVVVEFERASGSKMRIRLKASDGVVLADLSRVFLESRA
jgi:hypothetical protein